MQDINEILNDRGETHGDFNHNSAVYSGFKKIVRDNYVGRAPIASIELALDAIFLKLSRILSGNSQEVDHWRDIAGYATLAAEQLSQKKDTPRG